MPLGKRQRKLLLVLCLGLAVCVFLGLALPLWLPWVLRPAASRFGAHYARYERNGYRRFVLYEVAYTNSAIRFQAARLDLLQPVLWLGGTLLGKKSPEPIARADRWQLDLVPGGGKASGTSTYTNVHEIQTVIGKLRNWLPMATLSHGTIDLEHTAIDLPSVSWNRGKLRLTVLAPEPSFSPSLLGTRAATSNQPPARHLMPLTIAADLVTATDSDVMIQSEPLGLESRIRLSRDDSALTIQSTTRWRTNTIAAEARFGRSGGLPAVASLRAETLSVPGEQLGLKEYRNILGSVVGKWEQGRFAVDLSAGATPPAAATNVPPLTVQLHATGNTNMAIIHSAHVVSAGLEADLSKDLQIYFTGKFLREPTALKLRLDLSQQSWVPVQGVLDGEAQLAPAAGKFPEVSFRLAGAQIGTAKLKAAALKIQGTLAWPALDIKQATTVLDDGSAAALSGQFDLEKKSLAHGLFDLHGRYLNRWLPAGYSYQDLSLSGALEGTFKSLAHSGRLTVTNLLVPSLKPLQAQAEWKGEHLNFEQAKVVLSAGASTLLAEGSVSFPNQLRLRTLTLARGGEGLMTLKAPATLSATRQTPAASNWFVRVDDFHWAGAKERLKAQAAIDWPNSGTLSGSAENLSSELLRDFLKQPPEPFELRSIKGSASWTNGPIAFEVGASAALLPDKQLPLEAGLKLRGDLNGITISNCSISSQTSVVAVAHGFIPLTLEPAGPTNFINFNPQSQFQLEASTEPQSVFWEKVAGWTGLSLTAPQVRVSLSGTWQAPRGLVQVQAAQVQLRKPASKLHALEDLDLVLHLDHQVARVNRCLFLIQGQRVTVTAEVPLGERVWSQTPKMPDWRQAQAHLQMQDAQLAALTSILPNVLSPQGELTVDATLQPGQQFSGRLVVQHARTRPLSGLGPIRDIELKMSFRQQILQLESASARIGAAPISVKGQADLSGLDLMNPVVPPFSLAVRGTDVPLSRQPASIIRSDLDLRLVKTNSAPALLSGTARLRDSFYLHDLADLVPGKVASPSRRPPYFSIDSEPLAGWRLAVHVTGERFLKVRSTIFNGEVSANLNLQGTLKEPVALGDVRIDSGFVRFPFAVLKVQQGFVSLTSQDPYRPELELSAASKQYGYDLKMTMTGPADAPLLQFSSMPALSSEQILLMVTAGELPREERSLSTQQRAQTLALFIGRDLLTKLGFGQETEQRLTIHSGEELSEQGRPTYNVEYELTPRWSIVGEYDRFNAYNAGLKWRIYSK